MAKRLTDQFGQLIKDLIQDAQQLKNAQLLGSDSLVGYLTHSNSLNDFTTHLGAHETKKFRLTFLNDTAKNGAIEKLSFFWSINQPDVMSFYVPAWSNGPAISSLLQKETPLGDRSTWIFTLTNNDALGTAYDAYVKVFFNGTDSGAFSFVQI